MALESSTWLLQYMRHLLLSQVATIVIVIIMWFVIHRGDMGAKEHGFLHRKQHVQVERARVRTRRTGGYSRPTGLLSVPILKSADVPGDE